MRPTAIAALLAAVSLSASHAATKPDLHASAFAHLVGSWLVTGPEEGKPTCNSAQAGFVLGGQFLQLSFHSLTPGRPFDAMIFMGVDGPSLSVHWLDDFGASYAKTLGTGTLQADGAMFLFPYPGDPFHSRFSYDAAHDRWRLLIHSGDGAKSALFSDWIFTRTPTLPTRCPAA